MQKSASRSHAEKLPAPRQGLSGRNVDPVRGAEKSEHAERDATQWSDRRDDDVPLLSTNAVTQEMNEMNATLPQWCADIISNPPAAGTGFHLWLFRAGRALWKCGRDENEIRAI